MFDIRERHRRRARGPVRRHIEDPRGFELAVEKIRGRPSRGRRVDARGGTAKPSDGDAESARVDRDADGARKADESEYGGA